jgi:hypothetical protein
MPVRGLLACCLLISAVAAHAGPHRFFALSFDPHEKSSLAIAKTKSAHDPRLAPLSWLQRERDAKPRFEISGKRLKFRLPF